MQSGDIYIYTLRDTIKSESRITQERIFLSLFKYKIISAFDFLLATEKDKGKKADKEKLRVFKEGLQGKTKQDYFTDGGIYIQFLDKWVETKEGWNNLKRKL